ncbi:GtrA family protein [Pontiella sp.]|uniref:GtrA family protein n=1 Tax=Pontiella sp. TaxID=2837462 RepID=UPI00356602C2
MKKILLEKNHPGLQFIKYAFCGGIAFFTDMFTFFILGWKLFPALKNDEMLVKLFGLQVEVVTDSERSVNFIICSTIAFLISNFVAYVLNVRFVFKAGKHSFWKEFGLFYLVSGISIAIGTALGAGLVYMFGLSALFSYVAKAFSSTMINYAGRKFIIFHG